MDCRREKKIKDVNQDAVNTTNSDGNMTLAKCTTKSGPVLFSCGK